MNLNDRFTLSQPSTEAPYKCYTCGALVGEPDLELHNDWHDELSTGTEPRRAGCVDRELPSPVANRPATPSGDDKSSVLAVPTHSEAQRIAAFELVESNRKLRELLRNAYRTFSRFAVHNNFPPDELYESKVRELDE